MGDIADFTNECFEDGGHWNCEIDEESFPEPPRTVTCKHCGTKGLHWHKNDNGKWWLINATGEWHKCQPKNSNQ